MDSGFKALTKGLFYEVIRKSDGDYLVKSNLKNSCKHSMVNFSKNFKETIPLKIEKILQVKPFKIALLWNNGEIRKIDFEIMFEDWELNSHSNLLRLKNYDEFKQVKLSDDKTLEWENLPIEITIKGEKRIFSLALCPDVIYKNSELIKF